LRAMCMASSKLKSTVSWATTSTALSN